MISVVVSMFTAPINVVVDLLFEDILMAPSSDINNQSRNAAEVTPLGNSTTSCTKQTRNSKLLKSVNSRLLLSAERQQMEIPEETAAAHGRATMVLSRTLSNVASRQNMDETIDSSVEQLFRKMMSELQQQRRILNRRQQIAFDTSWRYQCYLCVMYFFS